VNGWRKAWGRDNLPFYYVQIAPYLYSGYGHSPEALPFFWEAQTKALAIPHTGMIVVTDLVDALADIHTHNKQEVARRLVLLALAHDYGRQGLEYSGPMYKRKEVLGSKIVLSFEHADGLMSKDGKALTHFTIAGADQKFVPAEAIIKGNKVIVSSPQVTRPVAVRFAWRETAMPNLFNKAGLPAVPFRTDEWPMPPHTVKPKP
jgi:sialate O-acetylesterase